MIRGKASVSGAAARSDIYRLYEQSVQCAAAEIDFVDTTFARLRGYRGTILREDFCGTAGVCCEWVRRRKTNKAIAVDIDEQVLAWGRRNNISQLTSLQASRISLINADVMTADTGKIDMVLAMNFSYWVFKDRAEMINYFNRLYWCLNDDGICFLDAFGGYEACQELEEETDCGDFTYIWDQANYDPVTGDYTCHIHFKFKDGHRIDKAFSYDWRLWSLPEITEMLSSAGFKATVYWEQDGEDNGEGNGIYEPVARGSADPGWIAYIVAEKLPGK